MSALCYGRGGLALTEDRKREFLATTAKAFVESANAFMEAHGGGWIAGADITVADFVYWHVRLNGGPRSPARVGRGGETDRDPRSRPPGARETQPVRGGRARRRAETAGDDRGSRGAAGRQDVHGERRLHPLAHLRCVSSGAPAHRAFGASSLISDIASSTLRSRRLRALGRRGRRPEDGAMMRRTRFNRQ